MYAPGPDAKEFFEMQERRRRRLDLVRRIAFDALAVVLVAAVCSITFLRP